MNNGSMIAKMAADPELKQAGTTPLCTFRVVHDQGWGERKKGVFWKCKAFGKVAERVAAGFPKGKPIFITYRLEQETWQPKEGPERTDIVLIISEVGFVPRESQQSAPPQEQPAAVDPNADIPF